MKTPANYCTFPFDSALREAESETIAQNIMIILSRNGNTFRKLSYEEYVKERKMDCNFSEREREYFNKVVNYCKSSDDADLFCKKWYKET